MNIANPGDSEYRKKNVLALWNALKPEGVLSWNPKVPKFHWGLAADDEEKSKVSEDLEADEVAQKRFEEEFWWLADLNDDV